LFNFSSHPKTSFCGGHGSGICWITMLAVAGVGRMGASKGGITAFKYMRDVSERTHGY
jgi:hypothetical protein